MLEVWLLGRLAVKWNGEALVLPSAERVQALIGYLALHPGSPLPRREVAAALWPDVQDDAARASLRTALWSLSRSWEPNSDVFLTASRSFIGLVAGGMWVDVIDADPGDGQLLPGVDDEWAVIAREDLRRRRLARFDGEAAVAEADGRLDDAIAAARRRCALAPLDEPAHRRLIALLVAGGDRAGAAETGRDFGRLLREELGVTPSPATRAAHAGVRSGQPVSVRRQLYGRAPEIAVLEQQWQTAAQGAGRVVVLTGEGGIGKSSLLAELGQRVGAAGGRRAVGTGIDVGGETPFATWLELAGQLVIAVPTPRPAALWPAELNRLSSALGGRLGRMAAPPIVASPELERLRVFEAVLSLVEWSCADRPLLIALDDVHRVDTVSLRLTAHIGRRIAGLPVLLALVRRDRPSKPAIDSLLADLVGSGLPVTELEVPPIGDAAVAAIAQSVAGRSLNDVMLGRVIAAAEGNPLLAEETARSAIAGGGPAPNLRTAVRATIRGLSPAARDLTRLLAAAGRPLQASELTGLQIDHVDHAADEALETGLLVDRQIGIGFRHALLREAVYADVDSTRSLHDRVANAIQAGDPVERAHHLALAGRNAEAAASWAAAAAHARSVGALQQAVDFSHRATTLDVANGHWWQDLAEYCAWSGRRDEMAAAFAKSLDLLPRNELAEAWCRHGRQLRTVLCNPTASLGAYRQGARHVFPNVPAEIQAAVLIGLAWGEAVAGDVGGVDNLLGAATDLLPIDLDDDTRSDIGEIRLLRLIRQGRFDECGDAARAAATSAGRALRPDRGFAIWLHAACAETCAGDFPAALQLVDLAVESTKAVPVLLLGSLAARAQILARLGRFEEAAQCATRELECAERTDEPRLLDTARHDAGLIALAASKYLDAAGLLTEALAGRPQVSRPSASLACAEALALAGDPDGAAKQLRVMATEPVSRADQPWALVPKMCRVQGLIAAAVGDSTLARRRFQEAAAGWRRVLASVTSATVEGYLANLVDLGRLPVVGLIEPQRELNQLVADLAAIGDQSASSTIEVT
jgi:DNA-binding SARP family transcriptional activator/tetratricopeptide (TPR) repeat protein